jgi:hypothetical protein
MITLDKLKTTDLYNLMDELDFIMRQPRFNSMPFAERVGVRRMRTGLDYVASGLRMMQGGDYEPHSVQSIHGRRRHGS